MCWSWEVSLATFAVGAGSVWSWYQRKQITLPHALFWLSFISMQLIETILWVSINNNLVLLNKIGSILGAGIIAIQPIASANRLSNKQLWFILYIIAFIAFLLFGKKGIEFDTVVAKNGHLMWKWIPTEPIWIGLWAFFLLAPSWNYPLGFAAGLFTFLISLYLYSKDGTWGSMWCWIVALFVLYHWFVVLKK